MADYPILFTGKEVNFEPRTTGELERARQDFNEKFLKAEEFKYLQKEKRRTEFYDMSNLSPVQLMNEKLTEMQATDLDNFNEKWAKTYTETDGRLSEAQKMEMLRDRRRIEAKQMQWLASQKKFDLDYEIFKRDQAKASPMFDPAAFAQATLDYNSTGNYEGGLSYTPRNPTQFFINFGKTYKGTEQKSMTSQLIGGVEYTTETGYNATPEEGMRAIEAQIMGDQTGRLLKGVIIDFMSQPEEVKAEYLVQGDVDTPEEGNAVMRWAQQYYLPLVRKTSTDIANEERAGAYKLRGSRIANDKGVTLVGTSDSVNGVIIGDGSKGLEFNFIKPIDLATQSVTTADGSKIVNQSIKARPIIAAYKDGVLKVEFVVEGNGVKIQKEADSLLDVPRNQRQGKDKVNGKYVYEEEIPSGTRVVADMKSVVGDLNLHLGGDELVKLLGQDFKGWDQNSSPGSKWKVK